MPQSLNPEEQILVSTAGSLPRTPELIAANAALIQEMLNGQRPVPASIATQVQAIVSLHRQLSAQGAQA